MATKDQAKLPIRKIKHWPPGSIMMFNNTDLAWRLERAGSRVKEHVAIGMVVSNDGKDTICVLWDGHCDEPFCVYAVSGLNPTVISRLQH